MDSIRFIDREASGEIALGASLGDLSVIDYDNDGWMDLILGERDGRTNRLFRNVADSTGLGKRTFQDVTTGAYHEQAKKS